VLSRMPTLCKKGCGIYNNLSHWAKGSEAAKTGTSSKAGRKQPMQPIREDDGSEGFHPEDDAAGSESSTGGSAREGEEDETRKAHADVAKVLGQMKTNSAIGRGRGRSNRGRGATKPRGGSNSLDSSKVPAKRQAKDKDKDGRASKKRKPAKNSGAGPSA